MTFPQILMLNHASWVNSKRMDARIKAKSGTANISVNAEQPGPTFNGKPVSELDSEELVAYVSGVGI